MSALHWELYGYGYETTEEFIDYCVYSAASMGEAVRLICREEELHEGALGALCVARRVLYEVKQTLSGTDRVRCLSDESQLLEESERLLLEAEECLDAPSRWKSWRLRLAFRLSHRKARRLHHVLSKCIRNTSS